MAVYELDRKLPNNTLILEGNELTFSATVNIWQEGYHNENGGDRTDRYSAQGEKYYYKPGDPEFYANAFKLDDDRLGDGYLGGCQFEVTHEDGTVAIVDGYATQTSYFNGKTIVGLVLKRGRNTIRCIKPPAYGVKLYTYPNNEIHSFSLMSDDKYYFDMDNHTETVDITYEDLQQLKSGSYQPKTFDYYFNTPKLDVEIVKLGLPPYTTTYGTYDKDGRYISDYGNCYDYCYALKFTYRGVYYGYLQVGIAPVGLLKCHRGYYDNGHTWKSWTYVFNRDDYPDLDYDDPFVIDMTEPHHSILTAQSVGHLLYVTDDSLSGGGDWHHSNGSWHETTVVRFGSVRLLEHLGDHITWAHHSYYHYPSYVDYNYCPLSSNPRLMITNYLRLGNCLNETGGINPDNQVSQQYYYLGDGLTKEQANFFISTIAYRNESVHITDSTGD